MKTFQNTYTTIEQSKRLLELGLPKDTADMFYSELLHGGYETYPYICIGHYVDSLTTVPCWSVGRLMSIIDICNKETKNFTGDYPTPFTIDNQLGITYIEYLVNAIEYGIESDELDLSKLED